MSPESEKPGGEDQIEEWIRQAREGSQEALGRLLDLCRRYLLLVASHELAPVVRAKVAPSDIVQETLLEAGRDFPDFRGMTEEELLGWMRQILRNNVTNVHRYFDAEKRQVERELPLRSAADPLLDNAIQQPETPSVQAQAREQDEQLEQALMRLPEHYRQILLLYTSGDLTFVQIAEKLGNTPDAVRKLWGRAVDELAKLLGSSDESA